jgi:hypothetical protein
MKNILFILFTLASLASVEAQGILQFTVNFSGANEVPPNGSTGDGSGTLTLNAATLDYLFSGTVFFQGGAQPTDITINGPAATGSIASVLFDLGVPNIFAIQPPPGVAYSLQGTINSLTGTQISDLENGLWYVNIFTSSGDYPDGEIRGQITPVPEPSALALLGLGIGGIGLWFRRKTP